MHTVPRRRYLRHSGVSVTVGASERAQSRCNTYADMIAGVVWCSAVFFCVFPFVISVGALRDCFEQWARRVKAKEDFNMYQVMRCGLQDRLCGANRKKNRNRSAPFRRLNRTQSGNEVTF